ncbi:tetratricopeptide repeat protein [Nitrospira sp. M1]
MKRRLSQIMTCVLPRQDVGGGYRNYSQVIPYRMVISLVVFACLPWSGPVEGGVVAPSFSMGNWSPHWEMGQVHSHARYQVSHHPAGPTMYHDYYQLKNDRHIGQLVRLVESAHTKRILPLLQQSFKRPGHKEHYLRQASREIRYTLDRLVNHPKALALSATVGNLMGQPNLPVNYYQRAIKMYPKHAITHAQFGNFLVGIGEFEDGIERLKIAIKINPKMAASYGWLAWAYQKSGENELAQEYSQKAKERNFKGKLP